MIISNHNAPLDTPVVCPHVKCIVGHDIDLSTITKAFNAERPERSCPMCNLNRSTKAKAKVYRALFEKGDRIIGEYIDTVTPTKTICINGHVGLITPKVSKRSQWCKICPKRSGVQCTAENGERKFTEAVRLKGGSVVGVYVNSKTRINVDCGNGHIVPMTPAQVTNCDAWCIKCDGQCPEDAENKFRQTVGLKGGIVVGVYVNSRTRVAIKCALHDIFLMTPNDISSGHWCALCAGLSPITGRNNFMRVLGERGWVAVEKYIHNKKRILVICENGHYVKVRPNDVVSNNRGCAKCANLCPIQACERFDMALVLEGYKRIGEYVRSKDYVNVICPEGHNALVTPSGFTVDGQRCKTCYPTRCSKVEIDWIRSIMDNEKISIQCGMSPDGQYHIPGVGDVDGYCITNNTVYEFHGDYWHGNPIKFHPEHVNPANGKTYGKLYQKTMERDAKIRALGYNLIVMWEYDYRLSIKNNSLRSSPIV